MKNLITGIFLLFFFGGSAQTNLDTVRVRNLTLQAQDWAWLAGGVGGNDSIGVLTLRIMRAKVQQSIPPNWTTTITIDSLPGKAVLGFYGSTVNASAQEIDARYLAIKNAIAAVPQLSYYIGLIDGIGAGDFNRRRDLGKNKLID